MDLSIKLDKTNFTFVGGETVSGSIIVHCSHWIILSRITASLIGESKSTLKGHRGLLMRRAEQEKHRFVHELRVIVPYRCDVGIADKESLRLGPGYHSFEFSLKIPKSSECGSCSPRSTMPYYDDISGKNGCDSFQNLPPSMVDLVKGAEVSYHIDVAVTAMQKLINFTARQSTAVNIWPVDTNPRLVAGTAAQEFCDKRSIQAAVLAPPEDLAASSSSTDLTPATDPPARILVVLSFLSRCNITHYNDIAMRLKVRRLHPYPHSMYLESFQLLLFGYTTGRAGSATDEHLSCWTIQTSSNLGIAIFDPEDENDGEMERDVDPSLWEGKRLPHEAVPSFEACNVARRYELEVSMGFQCRGPKGQAGRLLVVQLRIPISISSGIVLDEQLDGAILKEVGEKYMIALEDSPEFEDPVADGFRHSASHERGNKSHNSAVAFPRLPTYEEVSVEKST